MKLRVALSNTDETIKVLKASVGPFVPGVSLISVDVVEDGVRLTFEFTGGRSMKVLGSALSKLLRIVPPGTKVGQARFAGKGEPFVLTLGL